MTISQELVSEKKAALHKEAPHTDALKLTKNKWR